MLRGSLVKSLYESVREVLARGVGAISSAAIVASSTITGTRLIASAAGSAAAPAVVATSGVGLYDVGSNTGGLAANTGVFLTWGAGGITLLNARTTISHGFATTGINSPSTITSNQTDYNPFGASSNLITEIRLVSDAARTINSLAAGVSGQRVRLWNINTDTARTITLLHDDGSTGTAAQRFFCPNNANVVIRANGCVEIWYDATSSRWRVVGI